jgi:PAS domain
LGCPARPPACARTQRNRAGSHQERLSRYFHSLLRFIDSPFFSSSWDARLRALYTGAEEPAFSCSLGQTTLWDKQKRDLVFDVTTIVCDESIGMVAGAIGWTAEGFSIDLELLLLPLRHGGRTHTRLIGSLAPLRVPAWLGATPVTTLALSAHRFLGERPERPVPLARPLPMSRLRHGLVVYDGGRLEGASG